MSIATRIGGLHCARSRGSRFQGRCSLDAGRCVSRLVSVAALCMVRVCAVAAAEPSQPGASAPASGATVQAVWAPRSLTNFTMPMVVNSENGPMEAASCDQLSSTLQNFLLRFGARRTDIKIDQRSC